MSDMLIMGWEETFFDVVFTARHDFRGALMFAPRVFVSMIGALGVFALVTFILTGSAWTTFWQTLVCAVLLQIGYFVAVLALVWKAGKERRAATVDQSRSSTSSKIDESDAKSIQVSNPPRHLNS